MVIGGGGETLTLVNRRTLPVSLACFRRKIPKPLSLIRSPLQYPPYSPANHRANPTAHRDFLTRPPLLHPERGDFLLSHHGFPSDCRKLSANKSRPAAFSSACSYTLLKRFVSTSLRWTPKVGQRIARPSVGVAALQHYFLSIGFAVSRSLKTEAMLT